MNFWKNWPYWLRGGVIGGGITFVFVVFLSLCGFLSSSYGVIGCGVFLLFSPLILGLRIINVMGSVWGVESISNSGIFSFQILMLMNVLIWFIIGSLIGAIVGYTKSRKRNPK